MIDQYLKHLQEGYLLSDKTISVNLDQFLSGQKNKLLIIGVMGSGKTTIGEKLAKQLKVKWYSLDSFWWRIKQKHFPNANRYNEMTEEDMRKMDKLFNDNVVRILNLKERCIVEGINLMDDPFRKIALKQAMIILGVSSVRAAMRGAKRNRAREDEGWMTYYWMQKSNWKVESKLKEFKKDLSKMTGADIKEYKGG